MKLYPTLLLTSTVGSFTQTADAAISTVAFTVPANQSMPSVQSPHIRSANNNSNLTYDGSISGSSDCSTWFGMTDAHPIGTLLPNTTFFPAAALPPESNFTTGKIQLADGCNVTINFQTNKASELANARLDSDSPNCTSLPTLNTSASTQNTAVFALQNNASKPCESFSPEPNVNAIGVFPIPSIPATLQTSFTVRDSNGNVFASTASKEDKFGNTLNDGPFRMSNGSLVSKLPPGSYVITNYPLGSPNGTCLTNIPFAIGENGTVSTTNSIAAHPKNRSRLFHNQKLPSCKPNFTVSQDMGQVDFHTKLGA